MAIKYIYQGEIFNDTDVQEAAAKRNMDVETYTKQFKIQPFEDVYEKDGNEVPLEVIADQASKANVGVGDFLSSNNFKKKDLSIPVSGAESSDGSQLQSPSPLGPIDPKKLAREKKSLLATLQNVKDNPTIKSGVTDAFGTQELAEPRTKEIEELQIKIKGIDEQLVGSGYNPNDFDALSTLPDWMDAAGGWKSPDRMMQYKKENPNWYNRQMNKILGMDLFMSKNNQRGAYEFQNLLIPDKGIPNTLPDLKARFDMISSVVDSNIPEDKPKALEYAKQYLKPEFNKWLPGLSENSMKAFKLDSDQQAALEEMKVFNPTKYEETIKVLSVPYEPTGDNLAFNKPLLQWELDKKRGIERARYDLKVAGRANSYEYALSRMQDWKIKFDDAKSEDEKADAAMQMEQWRDRINALNEDAKTDSKNFPLYYEDQNQRVAMDLLNDSNFNPFTYALKSNVHKVKVALEGLGELAFSPIASIASELIGPEFEGERMATKMGAAQEDAVEMYLPQGLQMREPDMLIRPNEELKSYIDDLKKSGKTIKEQREAVEEYLQNDPNAYESYENPVAGQSKGLVSKAGMYANIKTVADIAALAGMTTTARATKLLGANTSTVLPFYLDVQQESYKQRINSGSTHSDAYKNSVKDGLVIAAATLISPIHNIAKAALGKATSESLTKTIGGITENEWNAITSKYGRYVVGGTNALKAVGTEALKMGAVYGAGTTAAQELLEMSPDKKDFKEIIRNAELATYDILTSSGLLMGITGITNFKTVSPQAKQSMYSMALEPLAAKSYFDILAKNNIITPESAAQKKAVVDQLSATVKKVPYRDKTGRPLTEEQRAGYMYRQYQKERFNEMSLPEQTKSELKENVNQMEEANAKVMNGVAENDLFKAEAPEVNKDIIASNVQNEMNRLMQFDIENSDGATFNIDGTPYTGKGLVVTFYSENMPQEQATPERFAQFMEANKAKFGPSTVAGVYKLPGEKTTSFDISFIVDPKNVDAAVAFAKIAGQESIFNLNNMENIKTGATGMKPRDFTPEQISVIRKALNEGKIPEVLGKSYTAETVGQINMEGMTPTQRLVVSDAKNVLSAIKPTTGEAKPRLFTYENEAEYGQAVELAGGTKEEASTKGFYYGKDGSIHINLNRATQETMLHEGFHPVLNFIAENKPEVVRELFRQLESIPEAKAIIDAARRKYTGDVTQMKEAITDFNAKVGNGEIKINANMFDKVKQFLIDMMNKLGFNFESTKIANMKDAAELKNVAEMVQRAFRSGEEISKEAVVSVQKAIEAAGQKRKETGEVKAGEKEGPLFFAKTDYGTSGITKKPALDKEEYKAEVKSGRISIVDPYKSLEGKKFAMTFPDDFFTGTVEVDGKPVGYGNGGVFYTAKHGKRGDAWASVSEGSASNFVKQANKSLEANNGEGIVAIVKGDDLKHKTSLESKVTFVNTILKYAENAGDTAGVVRAIKSAYNLGNVKDPAKIIEYFNNYLASGREESGQRMVDAGVSFDTFASSLIKEARPVVTKMMQDMGYKGDNFFDATQLKKGVELATTKGVKSMYADVLREDFLKDVPSGAAYAAIKFNSPLKFEKDPTHPSYPYVIRTEDGSPVKLEVFDKTFKTYGDDNAVLGRPKETEKAFGNVTTTKPYYSINANMKGNKSEVSLNELLTGYEALKPEFAKEDLVEQAGARKQMTEDDKGNYIFYHYSGADLKSIDPKKFGKNLATGRDERPGIGISMYYTRPDVLEANVPSDYGYAVRIPKNKVYHFNKDPLNLLPEAQKSFRKMYPDQAFDLNKQVAFVTQEAAKRGYPMTVAEWNIKGKKVLRAQTTEAMKPERYSNIVPGTMNQVEYNPELSQFKPNAKRRDIEFSVEDQKSAKDIIAENIQIGKPETKGAVARFFEKTGDENFGITWMDRLGREMLDSMFVFDKAAERVKGIRGLDEVLPANDPMTLARLLNGFDAAFNSAMDKGMFNAKLERIKSSDGKPMNIDWLMEPITGGQKVTREEYNQNVKDVVSYMVAQRTVELSKRFDREEMISGIGKEDVTDLAVAKKALEEFENNPNIENIKESASRYREMADASLRYMVDKGRLAEEVRDKDGNLIGGYKFIKENNLEYVAMKRLNESETGEPIEFNFKKGGAIGSKTEPIQKIKGSEKKIQDPYVSLLDNINRSMREANRNEVMLTFRNLIENEQDPQMKASLESIGKKVGSKDKETITVFVDGKPEYWKFQKDIYTALKGLDGEAYNLPGFFTILPRVLKWSVTRFPTFAGRNVVRDIQSRLILSNANPWESVKRTITTKDKWDEAAATGALNSGLYTQGKELYYELLANAADKVTKSGSFVITPDKVASLWHAYEKALYKSETTGRVSEYEASFNEAKKKGMDDYNAMLYAGSRARGLIDFAVAGNTMKVINQIIPFTNAAVQGLRSSLSRAKENPAGFAMRVMLYSLIPEVAVYALNNTSDEKKKMFEALPDWQRDMFYNIYMGENKWLSIPKPFELSLFGSALSRGISKVEGNDKAFDGYGGTLYKSLTPVEGTDIVGPYGKVIEVAANYDFFRDREIIPRSELALDMSLRNTESASRIGKVVGELIKKDPRMVDHFIKGQFSYFGKLGLDLSNIGRPKGEARDEFKLAEKSGFVKENSAYVSKPVQELRDYVDQWGLNGHQWMKYFKLYQDQYFAEKDPEEKERIGLDMMNFAQELLRIYKEVGMEDVQKVKRGK